MFNVGFIGRGKLGLEVLEGLLNKENIHVPIIICCGATPEVEDTSEKMQKIALERKIPFFKTNKLNNPEWRKILIKKKLDLVVAMLWLHTIDEKIIKTSRLGFINCHGGHLPKYRGNACANWAILNNEKFIGVSTHLMIPNNLDNGPIILQDKVEIKSDSYIGDIVEKIEQKGKTLVLKSVDCFQKDTVKLKVQNESLASYCYPRIPRDGEICWTQSAENILRLIRSVSRPYPGAYSWYMDHLENGQIKKLIIWKAHIENHHYYSFYSESGHVINLNKKDKCAIVCGDKKLLILDEIYIDNLKIKPSEAFRTVRQRMGLDLGLLAEKKEKELRAIQNLGSFATYFTTKYIDEVTKLEQEANELINAVSKRMGNNKKIIHKELVNQSFKKEWCEWERKECWNGISIRSSLVLNHSIDDFTIGYWLCNNKGEIERRIYILIKNKYEKYGNKIEKLFRLIFLGHINIARTENGFVHGIYTITDNNLINNIDYLHKLSLSILNEKN